jgi:predicted nucleic acid-binding protein
VASYFADTSFWIGLSRKRDQHHAASVAWLRFLVESKAEVLTTEAVLFEWLNAMSDVSSRLFAVESYLRIRGDSRIRIVPVNPTLLTVAVELYRARPDKVWSLTDCLSFVVMQGEGITQALTADRDFEQAGFRPCLLREPSA